MSNREGKGRVVFLPVENCHGYITGPMGAYYTTITYIWGGMEYEVLMENNEFILTEDFVEHNDE